MYISVIASRTLRTADEELRAAFMLREWLGRGHNAAAPARGRRFVCSIARSA